MSLLRVLTEAQDCTCFLILNPTVTPPLLLPACTCRRRQACASVRARTAACITDNRVSSFVLQKRVVIVPAFFSPGSWHAACAWTASGCSPCLAAALAHGSWRS